jgi:DNA repair protein RadC
VPFEGSRLDTLAAARLFFEEQFARTDSTLETLWAAHVDQTRLCVHLSRYQGAEASVPFPLRAIVIDAIEHDSAGILLAHNHPSGDARPSDSDCRSTRRLVTIAEALDCTVLDHLVFAGCDFTSFRQMGLL